MLQPPASSLPPSETKLWAALDLLGIHDAAVVECAPHSALLNRRGLDVQRVIAAPLSSGLDLFTLSSARVPVPLIYRYLDSHREGSCCTTRTQNRR